MSESLLELRDLRLVQTIAERGGATRAARVLHLSQSAVSHQLKKLEERLGTPMFAREGKALKITPAGQRLIDLAETVLLSVETVERAIVGGRAKSRQDLSVAMECYTAYHWLPAAFRALSTLHPEVDIQIKSEMEDIRPALLAGELALGLCLDRRGDRLLTAVPLFRDELMLVVAPSHPLAKNRYVLGEQLTRETFISTGVPSTQRERVRKVLFAAGKGFRRVVRVPNVEASLDLVNAGLGVAIATELALRKRLGRNEVVALPLTAKGIHRSWSALFRKNSPMVEPIRAFVDVLQQQARAQGYPPR
jgi:LysR family transcriptional regulator, regulator for metE and metH